MIVCLFVRFFDEVQLGTKKIMYFQVNVVEFKAKIREGNFLKYFFQIPTDKSASFEESCHASFEYTKKSLVDRIAAS